MHNSHVPKTILDRNAPSVIGLRTASKARLRIVSVLVFLVASSSILVALMPMTGTGAPDTWTIIVYMVGDNDLEEHAVDDFLELASVDTASNLNIVVQFDRYGGKYNYPDDYRFGNWTDCRRFVVTSGMTPTAENATMQLGEVDSADWHVLVDFVNWTVQNYPADHYLLDMWDHGADWLGLFWDDTDDHYMKLSELGNALSELSTYHPTLVYDIISFDACGMGSLEIAYEVAGFANYLLASEIRVPEDGLNYSSLQAIVDNPSISSVDLCNRFQTDYSSYYYSLVGTPKEYELNGSFSLSTVDLSTLSPLVSAIDALAIELIPNMDAWWDEVYEARNQTEDYSGSRFNDVVDIYHMSERLGEALWFSPEVQSLVTAVMDAFNASIVSEIHGTNPANSTVPVNHTNGLSIYYPGAEGYFDKAYLTINDSLQAITQWDEFLGIALFGCPYAAAWEPTGDSVPIDTDITAWVSEPIIPSPVSLRMYPTGQYGDWVMGVVQYNESERRLNFVPNLPLQPGVNYTVECSMRDFQGNTEYFSWQFTTAAEIPEFQSILLPLVILLAITLVSMRLAANKKN